MASSSRQAQSFASHSDFNVELAAVARSSRSIAYGVGVSSFSTTFQPYSGPRSLGNEDRHVMQRWRFRTGSWLFAAIFDGHAGHETAEYASVALPNVLKRALTTMCETTPLDPTAVSGRLTEAIQFFDDSFINDLRSFLPEDITNTEDQELRNLINDQATGGRNYRKVLRCMRGCTALVTLVDPAGKNIWVANLGDGQAVCGERSEAGLLVKLLSSPHNGSNLSEVRRIRSEHPGEFRAVVDGRVLGALATTRALGDHAFKMPAVFTRKVFLNTAPGYRAPSRVLELTSRIQTPPYVSNTPVVVHRAFESSDTTVKRGLLLCSDGLTDLGRGGIDDCARRWMEVILNGSGASSPHDQYEGLGGNQALHVLKRSLGESLEQQSAMLSKESNEPWMDDTTIIVLTW